MADKQFDILIIGSGPAGLTAGLYATRAGRKTAIIESLVSGGAINLTPDIANFPGFTEISGHELGAKMHEQAKKAGVEFIFDEITSIDLNTKTVTLPLEQIKAKAIIIATGASPRKLELPKEDDFFGAGIHTCGLCDGVFYKDKKVVIIGGGNSAVEEAIYMSDIAASVSIINNTSGFNAQQVLVEKLLSLPNLEKVIHNAEVTKILSDKKFAGIEIKASGIKSEINCDAIFLSIGRTPNTSLFDGKIELSKNGYIIVDKKMQTNIAGVYACGDVCEKYLRQIVTACADGAIAATAASEFTKN